MRPPVPVLVIVDEGYFGHEALGDELGPSFEVSVATGLGGALAAIAPLECPVVLAPRTLAPVTGDAVLDALTSHRFDFVGLLMVDDDLPTTSRGAHAIIRRPLKPEAFVDHIRVAASMRARLLDATTRRSELERDFSRLDHVLAHDLKGHLHAISGLLSLALELGDKSSLDDETRLFLSRASASGVRLSELIDGVSDWLRVSRRHLEPAIVDLGELLLETVAELRFPRPDASIILLTEAPLDLCARVPGDARAIGLAVQRLLENPLRLKSRVAISLEPTPRGFAFVVDSADTTWTASECERAFELLAPGPRELHSLALVALVAERHAGTIAFSPREGGGHRAVFELPCASEWPS
jgi:signal transduction histidine kinase